MKVLKGYAKSPLVVLSIFVYVCMLQAVAMGRHADPDLYFLINGGWEIIDTHSVPHELFNSIHKGFHTVMQQWLTCLMDAFLYNVAGFLGIKIVACLCYLMIITLMYMYAKDNIKTPSLRLLAVSFAMIPLGFFMNGRPWEISICIITAFLFFSQKFTKSQDCKWLISWPILSLLSSNFHSSLWIILMCFGFTYVCPGLMTFKNFRTMKTKMIPELKSKRVSWLFFFLMIPAAILNPNGIENITYSFKAYGKVATQAKLTISEMDVPEISSISGVCVLITILFLFYYLKNHWTDCNWQVTYLSIGTFILTIMHVRNMWIGALGTLPLICEVLKEWDKEKIQLQFDSRFMRSLNTISDKIVSKGCISITVITIITAIASLIIFTVNGGANDEDSRFSPVLAADYLDNVDDDIILYTGFNNGAYLAFRGYDVYMHAQPELYEKVINSKKDVYEEYQNLMTDPDYDYASFIESYGFNYLCIQKSAYLYQYVKYTPGFDIVIDSEEYILAKRINN